MTGFSSLVRLYLRDLSRRKLFWGLFLLTAAVVAVNYGVTRLMEDAMSKGESWDIATKKAAPSLNQLVGWLRPWVGFAAILLAAQLAPESRRNGTTQFVLSLGVRRNVLAAAQFVALGLVLSGAMLILHGGLAVAGAKTGFMGPADVALAWTSLLLPTLAVAASVFSVSLTASAFETYLLFLGVPFLTRTVPEAIGGFPKRFPIPLARFIGNVQLLFPSFEKLVAWPHLSFGGGTAEPQPHWHWALIHSLCAMLFWVTLGLWLQRRHDFGSRTALK